MRRMVVGARGRRGPRRQWMDCVREDLRAVGVMEEDALDWCGPAMATGDPHRQPNLEWDKKNSKPEASPGLIHRSYHNSKLDRPCSNQLTLRMRLKKHQKDCVGNSLSSRNIDPKDAADRQC